MNLLYMSKNKEFGFSVSPGIYVLRLLDGKGEEEEQGDEEAEEHEGGGHQGELEDPAAHVVGRPLLMEAHCSVVEEAVQEEHHHQHRLHTVFVYRAAFLEEN